MIYTRSNLMQELMQQKGVPLEVQDEILDAFSHVEQVYKEAVKDAGSHRVNFLSYTYVLSKICQLLGHEGVKHGFKTASNIDRSDKIWYHVCLLLGWPVSFDKKKLQLPVLGR